MTKVKNLSSNLTDSEDLAKAMVPIDVRKVVTQRIESLRRAGLDFVPKGSGELEFEFDSVDEAQCRNVAQTESPAPAVKEPTTEYSASATQSPAVHTAAIPASAKPSPVSASPSTPNILPEEAYGAIVANVDRFNALRVIQDEVAACTKCSELCEMRTQTVFGLGNPSTRLVFVGEGPGAEEDRKGEPFVGAAGQLLDKIINACKLSREEVYILNTVKCRPPGNRNPSKDELANCWGYAERQLEVIQPEFICCLGSVAAKTVLNSTQSLGRLRKRFHTYRSSKVLVTYHPAYLLRTPSAKKHVWEDMKMLMKEMGISL